MRAATTVTVFDSCADADRVVVKLDGRHVHLTAWQGTRRVVIYLDRLATLELVAALAEAAVAAR